MPDRTTQTNTTNQPSLLLVRVGGHRLYSRGFNRRGFFIYAFIYARFQPPRLPIQNIKNRSIALAQNLPNPPTNQNPRHSSTVAIRPYPHSQRNPQNTCHPNPNPSAKSHFFDSRTIYPIGDSSQNAAASELNFSKQPSPQSPRCELSPARFAPASSRYQYCDRLV
jgi:hypothetical protein